MSLSLKPEIEAKLAACAATRGLSVTDYLEALVEKQSPERLESKLSSNRD
jgi:hypothetical protein